MYIIYCGSASLLFKMVYKNSDKHETLLMEMALAPPRFQIKPIGHSAVFTRKTMRYLKITFALTLMVFPQM